jgi:hypothetical protein
MKESNMRFSFSKMLKDGQTVDLLDNWTANLGARIEAHDYGDEEPYIAATVHAKVFRRARCMAEIVTSEGVVFPKALAVKVREPLIKVLNEAMDFVEGVDLSTIYHRMKDKGTWPPDPSTWIKKEA